MVAKSNGIKVTVVLHGDSEQATNVAFVSNILVILKDGFYLTLKPYDSSITDGDGGFRDLKTGIASFRLDGKDSIF